MDKYYQQILTEVKKHAGKLPNHSWNNHYLGNSHSHYQLSNSLKRQIIKDWLRDKNLTLEELIVLENQLYQGKSYEEKYLAGVLWGYLPKLRKQLEPKLLDKWLGELIGWAEIDATCQSNFTAQELLDNWLEWEKLIKKLARDKNINKRRASLVLLTGVVAKSNDKRLSDLAFEIIDRLKSEKDILITKAISWLLRDLTYLHKRQLEDYLKTNADSLPKIAVRETKRKLLTGKK